MLLFESERGEGGREGGREGGMEGEYVYVLLNHLSIVCRR